MIDYTGYISKVMQQRRLEAQGKAEYLKRKAMESIPVYFELLSKQRLLGLKLLKKEITKEAFEEESFALNKKIDKVLTENGYNQKDFVPSYHCKICSDRGYVNSCMCSCMKEELTNAFFEQSGMRDSLKKDTFASFDIALFSKEKKENARSDRELIQMAKKTCEDFVDGFDSSAESLLILGPVGTGKTFLANCTANALIEKKKFILYLTSTDLVSKIMENEFDHSNTDDFYKYLEDCDLLIIDDLGVERSSEYAISSICNLIDKRIKLNKKMLITSNYSLNELKEHYSERLVSRILGSFKGIKLSGLSDLRLVKLKNKVQS